MTNKISMKSYSLRKLYSEIDRNIFAIPKLQRDFVWDGKKAAALFDSIYKHYPIGTILIWKTKRSNQYSLNHQSNVLPPFDDIHNSHVNFIIDGQQRLSVIYRISKGDIIENSKRKKIDFSNVVFSLGNKPDIYVKYLTRYNIDEYASVSDILSSNWRSTFKNYPIYKIKRIKKFRDKVLSYQLYFTSMEGYIKNDVRESFIRINSLGTSLTAADKAFTLASSFNFKHFIKDLINQLNQNFISLNPEVFLRTIVLINGFKQFGQNEIQKYSSQIDKSTTKQKQFKTDWNTLKHSFGKAIEYLQKNFFVISKELLPSENLIPILSSFFFYNKNSQPNKFQQSQIKKWFWYTSIGKRYSGQGYSSNILKDFEFMKKLAKQKSRPIYYIQEKLSRSLIRNTDYSVKSSTTSAFFCMLLKNKPRYLENFQPILLSDHSTILSRKNRHHIFPRQHLIDKGFSKTSYNSLTNICYLPQDENIKIGKKPPYKYLAEYKTKKRFNNFANSHLIPYAANSGIWEVNTKKGFRLFQQKRLALIVKEIEKFAGANIFEKE